MKSHLREVMFSHNHCMLTTSWLKGKRRKLDARPDCTGILEDINALDESVGHDFFNKKQSHCMTFGHLAAETNRKAKRRLCDLTTVQVGE